MHLVALKGLRESADRRHEELTAAGLTVLYDDRGESPGATFTDADLIGLPLRLTLSERALAEQGVEVKVRRTGERRLIPRVALIQTLREELTRVGDFTANYRGRRGSTPLKLPALLA